MSNRPLLQVFGVSQSDLSTVLDVSSLVGLQLNDPIGGVNIAALVVSPVMIDGAGTNPPTVTPFTAARREPVAGQFTDPALLVAHVGEWTESDAPAAGTAAVATRAAEATRIHVCRSITVTHCSDGTAATQALEVVLRDGVTGVGPILWRAKLRGGANSNGIITLAGLNINGSAGTAMTLEFLTAPDANHEVTVAFSGVTANP